MSHLNQCMRIMKVVIFLLVVVFSLTACRQPGAQGLTLKDISVYDTASKKSLNLNMTKAEVDTILGQPKQSSGNRFDYGDVVVSYKGNTVENYILQKNQGSQERYTFYNNEIKIGDSKDFVIAKLESIKSIALINGSKTLAKT